MIAAEVLRAVAVFHHPAAKPGSWIYFFPECPDMQGLGLTLLCAVQQVLLLHVLNVDCWS